jgi:nitrite reductase/ring-hydroxylating ferredoxin subunit
VNDPDLTRRRAVTGAVVGGLSLPVLAACGSGSGAAAPAATGSSGPAGSSGGSGGSAALVPVAQVPVAGGVILKVQNVVVTQPTKGQFEGFSATCTHQGCQLATVAGGTINCGCHGSQFAITDGANVTGPMGQPAGSVAPLGKVAVKVQGKNVVQG